MTNLPFYYTKQTSQSLYLTKNELEEIAEKGVVEAYLPTSVVKKSKLPYIARDLEKIELNGFSDRANVKIIEDVSEPPQQVFEAIKNETYSWINKSTKVSKIEVSLKEQEISKDYHNWH